YPDKAREVGEAVARGEAERAVFVCGSGVGASVAACKLPGIRAAVCHDVYSAHQGVEHDDMNVLCLGSDIVGPQLATDLKQKAVGTSLPGSGPSTGTAPQTLIPIWEPVITPPVVAGAGDGVSVVLIGGTEQQRQS